MTIESTPKRWSVLGLRSGDTQWKHIGHFDTREEAEVAAVALPKASVWEGRFRRGLYRNGKKVKDQ